MRPRVPFLVAGAALLLIGLSSAVPPCFGQDDDIQDMLDDLRGSATSNEFVDASYKQILLRSPELVTSMGLSQTLGIRDDRLDNICNDFVDDTYELKAGIHEILKTYQPLGAELRAADQLRLLLLAARWLGRRARVHVSLLPGHPRLQPSERPHSVLRGRAPSGDSRERRGLHQPSRAGRRSVRVPHPEPGGQ